MRGLDAARRASYQPFQAGSAAPRRLRAASLLRSAHGNARRRAARTGRSTPREPPPARELRRDLLVRHRPVADPRPRPRDRRAPLLRRRGLDQHLHGRVPAAEPAPVARRRRRALGRVRPRLQRAAREGKGDACLACRVDALLARAARPRRHHRALHPARAVAHEAVRLRGRAGRARRDALADPLPDRRPARSLGDRRRDPQQLRPLHRPRARAGGVEPRDHLRRRDRRPACGQRDGRALRLRRRRPRRHGRPVPAAAALAARPRRPAAGDHRLARPGRPADLRADAPGDARARAHQLQPGHQHVLRGPLHRSRSWRPRRSRRRSGSTCSRRGSSPSRSRPCSSRRCHGSPHARTTRACARPSPSGCARSASRSCRRARSARCSPSRSCGSSTSAAPSAPTRPTWSPTPSSRSRSASRSTGRCSC